MRPGYRNGSVNAAGVDNYFIQVLDGDVETAFPGIDAKTPGNLLDRRALLHQGEQSQIDLIALLQVAVKFEIAFFRLRHRMDKHKQRNSFVHGLAG